MNGSDAHAAKILFDREVSAETIAEWTAQTAAPKPARQAARQGALLVRAGKEWIALPTAIVESARPAGPVHSVPHMTSQAFLGLANVDGELLPCVSLAALAGGEPESVPARARLITVNVPEGRFALLADEALGTCGFDPEAASPPPDTVARSPHPLVTAMAELEGRTAGIVDTESLGRALARSLRP
ncbi:chemotaxis protein CheW [Fundidesulfovibrio terrae]|uniref:chemotaxis protein CheW n=1 Tax=Fundidesulfovibrio terrae TaxID=2922866 RepID=UPI001FAFF720